MGKHDKWNTHHDKIVCVYCRPLYAMVFSLLFELLFSNVVKLNLEYNNFI